MVSSVTHISPKEWKPYSPAAGSGPGRNSLGIKSQSTNLQFRVCFPEPMMKAKKMNANIIVQQSKKPFSFSPYYCKVLTLSIIFW